ncbi:MAG: M48 family metallopeptidase [Pirellulales bacterium]|nr:M48 family metallopeptidase [Pirellulales bacterium]
MNATSADSEPGETRVSADEMTPAELAEAKRYGRIHRNLSLLDKALDLAYLSVATFLLAVPVDRWLAESISSATVRLGMLYVIVILLHECLSLPLSYYSGYVVEHRFGQSNQTLRAWWWKHAKSFVLAMVFGGVLFTGLFWVIWLTGAWWWLVATGAFFLVSVVVGQLAPVLIMPLFYKIERIDHPELTSRMDRLAEGTGLSIEGVYRFDMSSETSGANAMLAGLGRTRRVIMGDTLLEGFTPDEIEVIFAHEIGHHVFAHIRKLIVSGALSSVAGFWLCDFALRAWVERVEGHAIDYATLPVYTLPLLMLSLGVFSLVVGPLHNIVSRRFERQCDRYALTRTGNRAAYTSAFRRLARMNKSDPCPDPIEVFLFHSHPPIAERLAMAEDP